MRVLYSGHWKRPMLVLFVEGVLNGFRVTDTFIDKSRRWRDGGRHGKSSEAESSMNRSEAVQRLAQCKPILVERYGVAQLALFGSVAREEVVAGSDLDVLVAFDGPATSARYFGVLFYLEDLFGCPVDLVTDKGLRPELRPFVEREAIHV